MIWPLRRVFRPKLDSVRGCLLAFACLALLASVEAHATTYRLPPPGDRIIGELKTVSAEEIDTLLDIARRQDVGFRDIVLANPGVDVWLPGAGTQVIIPSLYILPDAPREGVVINVPEMRLYYYPEAEAGEPATVVTYPISIGRQNWQTPLGLTTITAKVKDPAWYPPASIRAEHAANGDPLPPVVPAGPDNPLGRHALDLDIPGYLLHGTNKPYGIGMRVSHGCIRLYPEDIEVLFGNVPRGTQVRLVSQPYKAAWHEGYLYLEAHPLEPVDPAREVGELVDEQLLPEDLAKLMHVLGGMTYQSGYAVNWDAVEHRAQFYDGIPLPVPLIGQPPPERHVVEVQPAGASQ